MFELMPRMTEKSDYYAQDRKVSRHETPRKFSLLFVRQNERIERVPLLPIISDDANAARESPLAPLALQAAANNPTFDTFDVDGQDDRMYANLLDPMGPWHLEKNLAVPDCTTSLNFTTKHDQTNISVSHHLKVIIRVERGDDEAVDVRGRRKLFDIIMYDTRRMIDRIADLVAVRHLLRYWIVE